MMWLRTAALGGIVIAAYFLGVLGLAGLGEPQSIWLLQMAGLR